MGGDFWRFVAVQLLFKSVTMRVVIALFFFVFFVLFCACFYWTVGRYYFSLKSVWVTEDSGSRWVMISSLQ